MAVTLGTNDAKIIKTDSIVTAAWIRWKCRYGCPEYNKSLCCPPNSPTHHETRELVDCYEYVLLVHFTANVDKATEDLLDRIKVITRDITKVINTLERDIFLVGYYKAFALGAGHCQLCSECTLKDCRNPTIARPSMESCGIDVYSTVKNNGYPIERYIRHDEQLLPCTDRITWISGIIFSPWLFSLK
jgi:predicted metal-binding protein